MTTRARAEDQTPSREDVERSIRQRVGRFDFGALAAALARDGYALLPGLLRREECDAARAWYGEPERFRKRVDLARHGFGDRGEYQYFRRPLPPRVAALQRELYTPLARVANAWNAGLRNPPHHPERLAELRQRCRDAGQEQPTPLLLSYETGGYNCLHQDLYGEVAFPLQVAIGLSRPGRDYEGGAFLLVEQRPRKQSRGEAIVLAQGEGVVFPTAERPVEGKRGWSRARVRHGVSRVTRGERMTLGIIFHDARS